MAKKKKDFYIDERHIDYIKEVKEEKLLKYDSEALDLIIREHKENRDKNYPKLLEDILSKVEDNEKALNKILKFNKYSN
ncbi:hypothetical protein QJR26_18390 (plasmid) [Clostridium baratii]